MTSLTELLCGLLALWIVDLTVRWYRQRSRPPYPPGPRGLPIVGNVLDVPSENHWLAFAKLGNTYGEIVSLRILAQHIIIINSVEIAENILDTNGAIFSERPIVPMAGELAEFNNVVALCQYTDSERVKKERRMFHKLFGTRQAVKSFEGVVMEEVGRMLLKINETQGKGLVEEVRRTTGAITLRIAYGYRMQHGGPKEDPLHAMFETAGRNFTSSTRPMAFLVDVFPILRFWPESFPGGSFHTIARGMAKQVHSTIDAGLESVKTRMAAGTAEPSFMLKFLEERKNDSEEYLIKWAAASVQVGGSDTTAAQLSAFFLAMSLHPSIQKRAQEEIDSVLRSSAGVRLPTLADREPERGSFPYMEALCKELLRWHVAAPTALPHRAHEDFIYTNSTSGERMLIPKDAVILPNVWQMAHDPKRYPAPHLFNPERFLGEAPQQDPARMVFGYGRRICPGRLLADATLFLACTTILAAFDIKPRKNKDANPMATSSPHGLGQTSGTISHPFPFECIVTPRNESMIGLLRGPKNLSGEEL
ncbi:cytochrome P450 [Mycena amicta]|nr:cytochrome P450 [Mycena amicta]